MELWQSERALFDELVCRLSSDDGLEIAFLATQCFLEGISW